MTLIHWTPAMSVGMTELDDNHKQLINSLVKRLKVDRHTGQMRDIE